MYISRNAVEAAGGFDEGFGAGYEDADFCLKVKLAGMPVTCVGSSRVVASGQRDEGRIERYREEYRKRWEQYYRDRYETRVMWHSWINAPTGYAVSSQYLVLALEALDVDVRYGYVYGVEEPPNDDGRIMEVRRKPKDPRGIPEALGAVLPRQVRDPGHVALLDKRADRVRGLVAVPGPGAGSAGRGCPLRLRLRGRGTPQRRRSHHGGTQEAEGPRRHPGRVRPGGRVLQEQRQVQGGLLHAGG